MEEFLREHEKKSHFPTYTLLIIYREVIHRKYMGYFSHKSHKRHPIPNI